MRNKYGVSTKARRTVDGIVFDSRAEMTRWMELRLMEKAGAIFDLKRQVVYPLHVNGYFIGKYISDFSYFPDRDPSKFSVVIEDVKGVRTPVYRLKKKLMKAIYGIDILETGRTSGRSKRKGRVK
jgi:hypothetical protein